MKVTPSELKKLSYNQQQWNTIMEENARRLNDNLLYVSNLQDVDLSGIADGNLLQYNSVSGKFEPVSYNSIFTSSSTSTTTTTVACVGGYGPDRCNGGTASASDYFGVGYEADKAFDNSTTTRWSGVGDSLPEWLKYDLGVGVVRAFQKVRLYVFNHPVGPHTSVKDFKIQYSDNDSDWYDATSRRHPDGAEQWREWEWAFVGHHRYWRIYVTSSWRTDGGESCSIFEMELQECLDNTTTTTTTS